MTDRPGALVRFRYDRAGDIPLLVAEPVAQATEHRGTILWYHGFGVDKDANRKELERFAALGLTAIGVDVAGHGERRAPDLDARMAGTQADALHSVIEFASATAREVPDLIDSLIGSGIATEGRIALTGISMGAFVVYGAIPLAQRIGCAVAILGSPEWPRGESPSRHLLESVVPLLSITAECDVNVPPGPARRLHEELDRRRPDAAHRYVELRSAVHLMGEADWEAAMRETTAWLRATGVIATK